eukprot:272901-Chlamydomonas_euryale.AAC.1
MERRHLMRFGVPKQQERNMAVFLLAAEMRTQEGCRPPLAGGLPGPEASLGRRARWAGGLP